MPLQFGQGVHDAPAGQPRARCVRGPERDHRHLVRQPAGHRIGHHHRQITSDLGQQIPARRTPGLDPASAQADPAAHRARTPARGNQHLVFPGHPDDRNPRGPCQARVPFADHDPHILATAREFGRHGQHRHHMTVRGIRYEQERHDHSSMIFAADPRPWRMAILRGVTGRMILVFGALLAISIGVLIALPVLLYPSLTDLELHDVRSPEARVQLQQAQGQLQNNARGILLQAVAGALVLIGASATWRQVQVNREGQITDRFTHAIDQLGSDNIDVRLGGLYALERLTRDSPHDRSAIGSIMTSLIRRRMPLPDNDTALADELPWMQHRAVDVQTALKILGRRPPSPTEEPLYLSFTDLRRARMGGGRWDGLICRRSDMRDARLQRSRLSGAALDDADLRGARFVSACLRDASLRGARLEGADLTGADLTGADLTGVHSDESTQWPDGFSGTH
ncbi:pentapeptide repeat-containing protein [Pseudonocardiaceae bacterium YIM PH 21723]|nr:pentapeptide repeat-containing protein [Pseudonocardiaceae bacterium YIM PH 21723]